MKINKAVVPAAGRGTRLERITLVNAKELIPLVDRPAIDWIVREATFAGIEELCIVTSVNKLASLAAHTEGLPIKVTYLIQDKPRGLGDAVMVARNWCGNDPFALLLPDDLVLGDSILNRLVEHVVNNNQSALALTEVPKEKTHLYGIAAGENISGVVKINDLIEKPPSGAESSNLSVTGRYVLTPEIWQYLEKVQPGAGNEIQLTDALKGLARTGKLSGLVTGGMRHDLGSAESWLKANIAFGAELYGMDWLNNYLADLQDNSQK